MFDSFHNKWHINHIFSDLNVVNNISADKREYHGKRVFNEFGFDQQVFQFDVDESRLQGDL